MNAGQRTLVLMRHAKSAYPDGVADHDRPLAPRGVREAGLAGEWLRCNLPAIDQTLCSSAARTRETLRLTNVAAPVSYLDRLYGATPGALLGEVNRVGNDTKTLLVVGHEPTISQVAVGLAGVSGSDRGAVDEISMKFPTSGIAVLHVPVGWASLEIGTAALVAFHVPR